MSSDTAAHARRATRSSTSTPTPTQTTPADHRTFGELGVAEPFVQVLAAAGIVEPFAIQAATLPDSLAGRDVLGRGRTGSGKTLAFALPVLSRLLDAGNRREPDPPARPGPRPHP